MQASFHTVYNKVVKSCAGRVNPRGLRIPAFAERVREPALLCVRVRVELAAGRVRVVLGCCGCGAGAGWEILCAGNWVLSRSTWT